MGVTESFNNADITERFALARERIMDIPDECKHLECGGEYFYPDFFIKKADELCFLLNDFRKYGINNLKELTEEELAERNRKIYADILPENYEKSYSNPDYAEERLGIYGGALSFVSAELMTIPVMLSQIYGEDGLQEMAKVTYLLELFLYIYGLFKDGDKPNISEVESAIYYYAFDYIEEIARDRLIENTFPNNRSAASRIL